jgi:superfamily II DNA or RNA helicase
MNYNNLQSIDNIMLNANIKSLNLEGGKSKDITQVFKHYKVAKSNEKMEEFCLPKKFKLQAQQNFLPDLLTSNLSPLNSNDQRGILIFHQIGAGKTCTAIAIAEKFKYKMNIVVVLPAALMGNFVNELRSECPGDSYINQLERKQLKKYKPIDKEYKKIIERSNKRIEKFYTIYSYHKFIDLIKKGKIKKLNNTLLIIDEVQNMISMTGTFYKMLNNIINNSDDTLKLLLLSATPMFDKPIEVALTLNLLKKKELFDIDTFNQTYLKMNKKKDTIFYKAHNLNKFRKKIHNLISYYRGAPPVAFPKTIFKVVKCKMSSFQYKSYLTSLSTEGYVRGSFKNVDILNLSQNFFLGPRIISNVAFPNKCIGDKGCYSFKDDILQLQNISEYSIKFFKIYKNINISEGPVFVYSNFKELGGIKAFIKFLEYHGWKDYKMYGEGIKRFAIWTGDEPNHVKDEIKFIFNQKSNYDGSKIKIMLGSPSIKEGVSLLRVEQVHIMEPYWNMSRIYQIMGRAVRFCSHKDVAKSKRLVDIYLYLATYPNIKTADEYIWSLAKQKNKLINEFELALKETAFDCNLFYNHNSYKTDEVQLKCQN